MLKPTNRIALFGHTGLLGEKIYSDLRDQFNVYISTFDKSKSIWSSRNDIIKFVEDNDPHLIINCAALTDMELCEKSPELSFKANVSFVTHLAEIARLRDLKLVHMSSTGVYGTNSHSSTNIETSSTWPKNVHHLHKLISEKIVLSSSSKNLCLRLGWLYGNKYKNDFIEKIRLAILSRKRKTFIANPFQIGVPTNVEFVSKSTIQLIKQNQTGLFNLVSNSNSPVSRMQYVKLIVKFFRPDIVVIPGEKSNFERICDVALNESASIEKLKDNLPLFTVSNWDVCLQSYLEKNYKSKKF